MAVEERKYLTVTALTKYIKYKFDHDIHLETVLLEGEISNFKRHSRGHFYFTLKDEGAQISATMFYQAASKVSFDPRDGMKVYVKGSVSVYEPSGTYSINVVSMEEKGLGALYQAYEKLKKELAEKGYFDPLHKRPIPAFPKAIGIITSPTGAAVRDCINTISRRFPLAHIYVYPTLVQGDDAKNSIVANIELANKQGYVDTLIVGRGGGSIEDLWAFNEEVVAMAIYHSKIPVISAVGHETDFTIADFVADKRAATPTAAAELATPRVETLKDNLKVLTERLTVNFQNFLKQIETTLMHLDERLEANSPKHKLAEIWQQKLSLDHLLNVNMLNLLNLKRHELDLLNTRVLSLSPSKLLNDLYEKWQQNAKLMKINFQNALKYKEQSLMLLITSLKNLNPLAIMEKGYSIIYKDDIIIKSCKDLNKDDLIKIKLNDGSKKAIIMED